tara:strand:- start:1592 stop:2011 length:420 start_codon:yes stop_codon:yes gene_type:complete
MLALLAYQATLTLALTPSTSLRPALVAAAPRSARVATCSMAASEEDSTDYSTDWDSAWRTELRRREQGLVTWRPEGMEPVSTEVLLKARAATATDEAAVQLQEWNRDWRFWAGIIAVLSVTSAVATKLNEASEATAYLI